MTHALEQCYQRLLRSYPRSYRQERSAEIIGTLMELARPEQQRPTIREAAGLVLAGLRTRVGVHRRRTTAAVWAVALHWAAILALAYAAAVMLADSIGATQHLVLAGHLSAPSALNYLLTAGLVVGALLVTAAGRAWVALPLILVATVAQHWAPDSAGHPQVLWQLPIAAVLMIPLLRWRVPRPSRPARWLLAIPLALIIMPTHLPALLPIGLMRVVMDIQFFTLPAILLGCLLWSIVDARPTITAGALLLPWSVAAVMVWATSPSPAVLLVWAIAAVVPLVAGATRAAQRARL